MPASSRATRFSRIRFRSSSATLLRVALKQAPEANYHLSFLPKLAPWMFAYLRESRGEAMLEFAHKMRPLFAASVAEHESLIKEAGAERYLRKNGWLKAYRTRAAFESVRSDLDVIAKAGLEFTLLDRDGALALEPDLGAVARHGIFWPSAASVSNPLALTRAYVARFKELGGVVLTGDARSLHRADGRWRVDTVEGPVDAPEAVVALGPWAPDLLKPLGIDLPLQVKRGYHRHFKPLGNKGLNRPVLDAEIGYLMAPMEQGLRLTTGAEFADRDAPPTPVQFDRLMPAARELFPIGGRADAETWLGRRPCFPDSMPVIGRAPGQSGSVARLRPRALGADAWAGQRAPVGRDDDRADAVHRSQAVSGRALHFAIGETVADLEIEELSARRRVEEFVVNVLGHIFVDIAASGHKRDGKPFALGIVGNETNGGRHGSRSTRHLFSGSEPVPPARRRTGEGNAFAS